MNARSGLFAASLMAVCSSVCASAATRSVPDIPLSFEKESNGGYVAQSPGAAFAVDSTGMAVRSRAGTIRVNLLRSNRRAKLWASGDGGILNRFIGNRPERWITGVRLASTVTAAGVYPDIDIVYHGDNRRLEYDFVVGRGRDPRRIEFGIEGALSTSVDSAGNLRVATAAGEFVQHRPLAYQTIHGRRREVASDFCVNAGGRIGFALGDYDRSKPLTIDPIFSYISYLGGNNTDAANAVAVDASGNVYVAGSTYSTNLANTRTSSNQNVLLFKIPPQGSTTLSVFGGTAGNDTANAVTTDSSGNVYLAGGTSSANFPIAGNQFTGLSSGLLGQMNAFVLALTPNNSTLIFSTFIGGNVIDQALGMALDPTNSVLYVVGETSSTSFPVFASSTNGGTPFQETNHGGYDGFLLGISTSGVGQFATYIGGSGDEHANGVAVDSKGYVDVVGSSSSTDFPRAGDTSTTNHGGVDSFVIQLLPVAANGDWGIWSTLVGGSASDVAYGVALDSNSNVYVAGNTGSTDFPSTTGVYQATYQGGGSDGFVFMLRGSDGLGQWSTFLGTSTADSLSAIALDAPGNIYVTGTTDSTAWPVTSDAVQSKNAGSQDAIVAKLNNSGTSLLFSTYLGGTGIDTGSAVAVDSRGTFYVAGVTQSSNNDFPVTSGAFQTIFGGGQSDGFFAIFGCPAVVPAISSGGIANAASYKTDAISPGGIIAIFGTNLGCTAGSAGVLPLPTSIGGVSVQVNGTAVPLFYTSSGQINAQLPYETATGAASVKVISAGGTSAAVNVSVNAAGPGIISLGGQAAAYNQDGTLNTATVGAKPGSTISVYFTGQGPVSPAVASGAAAPDSPLSSVTLPHSATIGGHDAPVSFMGLAPGFVGLAQANVSIPAGLAAGSYPIVITVDSVASASAAITVSE